MDYILVKIQKASILALRTRWNIYLYAFFNCDQNVVGMARFSAIYPEI